MHDGWQGGEVSSQRDGGDGADGRLEGGQKLLLTNVQNFGAEGLAIIVDLSNSHTVGERRDVQHVEEGGFGSTNFRASFNELQIGSNFNGTTSNLGGDTESLEERGLSGLHTSVTGGDKDIQGSNGTGTSRGSNSVGKDLLSDFFQVSVGEDEANIALDVRQKALIFWVIREEAFDGTANLIGDQLLATCIT